MNITNDIKSISYLKSRAADLLLQINETHRPVIITQNGEAKVILQDIKVYEQTQESLALLKILAMSSKNLKAGKVKPVSQAFIDIREKREESDEE